MKDPSYLFCSTLNFSLSVCERAPNERQWHRQTDTQTQAARGFLELVSKKKTGNSHTCSQQQVALSLSLLRALQQVVVVLILGKKVVLRAINLSQARAQLVLLLLLLLSMTTFIIGPNSEGCLTHTHSGCNRFCFLCARASSSSLLLLLLLLFSTGDQSETRRRRRRGKS